MRISHHFPRLGQRCPHKLLRGLLPAVLLAVSPLQAAAFTVSIQVADGLGGRVIGIPGNASCMPSCIVEVPPQSLVSLFAAPDKGYRFTGWSGACADTLGPLCTLTAAENVNVAARFGKSTAAQKPAKALLLLHGTGDKNTVWNEFVSGHFNNRCPVVYGGVVLGEDAANPQNKVYCYRIAFGYYDMLNLSKTAGMLQQVGDVKAPPPIASKRLGYEIRAAVLGLLNRHPKLSLTLVGQESGALAAHSFLQAEKTGHSGMVVGLLALQPANVGLSDANVEVGGGHTKVLTLEAGPEQEGKISAALAQLTKAWWTAR